MYTTIIIWKEFGNFREFYGITIFRFYCVQLRFVFGKHLGRARFILVPSSFSESMSCDCLLKVRHIYTEHCSVPGEMLGRKSKVFTPFIWEFDVWMSITKDKWSVLPSECRKEFNNVTGFYALSMSVSSVCLSDYLNGLISPVDRRILIQFHLFWHVSADIPALLLSF